MVLYLPLLSSSEERNSLKTTTDCNLSTFYNAVYNVIALVDDNFSPSAVFLNCKSNPSRL